MSKGSAKMLALVAVANKLAKQAFAIAANRGIRREIHNVNIAFSIIHPTCSPWWPNELIKMKKQAKIGAVFRTAPTGSKKNNCLAFSPSFVHKVTS